MNIKLDPPAEVVAPRLTPVSVDSFSVTRVEFTLFGKSQLATFDWVGLDSEGAVVINGTVRLDGERSRTVFESLVPIEVYKEIASSLGTSFVLPKEASMEIRR